MRRRSWIVYGGLLATWILLIGWQAAEHARVKTSARAALINRAKDISNTLGLVMRSQRLFGVITKERLEYALNELVNHNELQSVVLLNATDEVVASAGKSIELPSKTDLLGGEHWDKESVTLVNLVDLGTNVTRELELTNLAIVIPAREIFASFPTNRPRPPRFGTNDLASPGLPGGAPGEPPRFENANDGPNRPPRPPPGDEPREGPPHHHQWRNGLGTNDSFFVRPFWMKEQEYQSLIQKKGVHSFVLVMSTQGIRPAYTDDLWMRIIIGILGTISVVGWGLAWRSVSRTSELQIRLVRASEQNLHLQQMNLAAAGLAHETRNPLNIIRGLAQLISKEQSASPEIRGKSRDIVDETDRVTAQLNEFINYSRPREVRRVPLNLNSVAGEVARALSYDVEEKKIRLQILIESLMIEADEQLLRQALFNLVLNAVQAVEMNGEIQIRARKSGNLEAVIEICDNGPGVASEHLDEIFKPYFTTHQKGTGLGLAIVRQIIMAHGWEIACRPNQPAGAVFCISHIKVMTH